MSEIPMYMALREQVILNRYGELFKRFLRDYAEEHAKKRGAEVIEREDLDAVLPIEWHELLINAAGN